MPKGSGLPERLGCGGAPLWLAVVSVALVACPGFVDPFTSPRWYVLEALAAAWLLSERLLCGGHGVPPFVRRTWLGWAALAAWVALGALRRGPAWAIAPLVARGSFVALAVASCWLFRRTALALGALRGSVAAAAAAVVTLGLLQMARPGPLPWLAGGDERSATFGNVNMAAQFLGLACVVVWSGLSRPTKPVHRHLAEVLGGASVAYVFLAGTRSVGAALVAALAVLALLGRVQVRSLARVAALAGLLVVLLLRPGSGPLGPEAQASKASSARLRLAVWSDTLELVRDHPLGVGAGNFEAAFVPYALRGQSRPGEHLVFRSPHSDYLRVLAEEGIPGAVVLLVLLALLMRDLHRSPAIGSWRSDAGAILASCGTYLAVEAAFQFPFEMAFPALAAAVLLGLALAAADPSPEPTPAPTLSRAWAGTLLSVALALGVVAGVARLSAAEVLSATRPQDEAALERACSLDPRRLEACVRAAWLRSRSDDHVAAQALLVGLLRRSPHYLPAIKLLAEDLLYAGDREGACRYARAYTALLGGASSLPSRLAEDCPPSDAPGSDPAIESPR